MIVIAPRAAALALAAILVVACSAGAEPPVASPADRGGPTATAVPAPTDGAQASPSASLSAAPVDDPVELTQPWATTPLVDVATGDEFRIADLAGKVIILETMAIWCPSCRAQQGDVQEALGRLPAGRVEFVVLDVDPSEDAASLAEYAAANGFEGRYAIAGDDVARALAAEFGDQFLNPPSTPMLIIGTDGTVTSTAFGHKSVDELVALAEAHGA